MKYLKIVALAAAIAFSPSLPAQEPSNEIVLDKIVAVVNEGIILHSELEQKLEIARRNLRGQNIDLPPESILRKQVMESLVLEEIQLQRADRLGLAVSDEELNRALASLAQRNGITLGDLPAALAIQGIDYADYREEVRRDMVLEQLRRRDVGSRISITRAEVDKMLAQSTPENIEYEVLHMLIAVDKNADEVQLQAAQKEAEDLYNRLNAGEDFEPLAIAYSDSPGVLQNRGNLGYLKPDALPSVFADKVTSMSPGEIAAPIKSDGGFHIVKLSDIRGLEKVMTEQRKARHILIQTDKVVDDSQARQRLEEILDKIRAGEDFAALAAAESDDPNGASEGGDLGWSPRGNFVPEFEAQLDNLEKMEISKPFKTAFGWHIVQLLDTRNYDSTLDLRRNQAAAALRARKFEEESQEWIQQLRDEAYVELRLDTNS